MGVDVYALDFVQINKAIYAMYVTELSDEGACYSCVPGDAGVAAASLGAIKSTAALGASESSVAGASEYVASAEALHTFTLDSGASRCFFHDCTTLTPLAAPVPVSLADPTGGPVVTRASTVLPCPAVPSGSLSGLHLPPFSTNLVSNAALQDVWVDTLTPGGQRVAISSCSCRVLSHQTLLWHHRLGHPSLARLLVSSLPMSLPSLPRSPAPPCLPCIEGQQHAAPHSSEFPPTTAPLQNLHMDVWGPAPVGGTDQERYFLLVVDDYTRYTTVFPLRRKANDSSPPVVHASGLSSAKWDCEHCIGLIIEVARTSMIHAAAPHFLWPFAVRYAAHQLNLWPRVSLPETSPTLHLTGQVGDASVFWVRGALSLVRDTTASKLSPRTLRCIFLGFPTDAPPWQFYHPSLRRVFSSHDVTFDESVYYYKLHPHASHSVPLAPLFLVPVPSSVDPLPPQGCLRRLRSLVLWNLELRLLVLEPGGAEAEGEGSGGAATGGAGSGGGETGGADSGGAASPGGGGGSSLASAGATSPGGAGGIAGGTRGAAGAGGTGAAGPGGARAAGPGGLASAGGTGAAGAVGAGAVGAGGAGRAGGTASAGGTRGGTGAGGTGANSPTGPRGAGGARGTTSARGTGAAGAGGAGAAGAGGTGGAGGAADAGGAGATIAGGTGAASVGGPAGTGGTGLAGALRHLLGLPPAPTEFPVAGTTPPLLFPQLLPHSPLPTRAPYTAVTESLAERREPETRASTPERRAPETPTSTPERPEPETRASVRARVPRVRRSCAPAVPDTHYMTLHPSSVPRRVVLPLPPESSLPAVADPLSDLARASCPTVTRVLATVVTDPTLSSPTVSALVAELVDFAAAYRLDFLASLVSDPDPACPPSVGGEIALGCGILEDRQEELQCLAAAAPHLATMMLVPEGDPHALDIPTPRSYREAISGEYSSQRQTTMDAEMASWKSTGTYVDEVPPPGANIVRGMWIFSLKRPPGSPPVFKACYVARGFSQPQHDYELHSLDFSTAFFLWRPVYGMCQAPREWHDTLRTTLAALGLAPSTAALSLFLRTDTTLLPFYVLVYVDDLVFATAYMEALVLVKAELQERHTYTDLGELRSYLGLHITRGRERRTITLTQSHMVHRVLQCFGFQYSSPQPTPLSNGHSLLAPPSDESVEPSGPYPKLVGCLICEAEIYPRAMAAQELRWLTYLLIDLGERPRSPLVLYVDNKAMLALCHKQRLKHRTKHIALRYFLARELQQQCQLRLSYVASRANTADVFTKALGSGDHQCFCTALGLVPTLPHLLVA
ncbi:unnamed protein product [Closterium sp. NIES-53]